MVASQSDQTISWYENNGSGGLAQRTLQVLQVGEGYSGGGLGSDGDIDVISMYFFGLHPLDENGTQNFVTHTILQQMELMGLIMAILMGMDSDIVLVPH